MGNPETLPVEERARKLLAAQYQRDHPDRAKRILAGASDKAAVDAVVTALAASQQQLAEWKLAYEEAEKAREVMRDEWNAAEQQFAEAVEVLRPFMPITVHETPDYAKITFGDHQTQAMTMDPKSWLALNEWFTKHRREG